MLTLILAAAATPAPPVRAELEPLAFLVGHCWRGTRPGGAVDTHCFEAVYGGKHVRDRHKIPGKTGSYEGETLYSWNGKAARIDYAYWNSIGDVYIGTGASDGKNGLTFDGGSIQWRRLGPTAYEVVQKGMPAIRFDRVD